MSTNSDPRASSGFGLKSRMSLLALARQMIRENRRALPFRLAGAAAEKYLHAFHNENFWEFERNGEMFAASTFRQWLNGRTTTIWDVGANAGQWAIEARNVIPDADIHCFEIIPAIMDELLLKTASLANVHAHSLGLSDETGEITVQLNPVDTVTSSIAPRVGAKWFPEETIPVACRVTTADEMMSQIPPPGFLKIDVEGHEVAVLRGAQTLLASPHAPAMMQIEYGDTYIPTGATLKAVYELVEPHGYVVGRLFPNHVAFKPYAYEDDTFRLGNLVATKDAELMKMLS